MYIFLDNPGVPGCLEVPGGGDRGDRGGGLCCPGGPGVAVGGWGAGVAGGSRKFRMSGFSG